MGEVEGKEGRTGAGTDERTEHAEIPIMDAKKIICQKLNQNNRFTAWLQHLELHTHLYTHLEFLSFACIERAPDLPGTPAKSGHDMWPDVPASSSRVNLKLLCARVVSS